MERDANPVLNMEYKILKEKVELSIKLTNNISIPAIILEYRNNDNLIFNLEDLKQFYARFGKVWNIINVGKQSIVLFKNFFSAYICKIVLENKDNYKNSIYSNNFIVRWFDLNRDINLVPNNMKEIFLNISNKNLMMLNASNNINNNDISIGVKMDMNLNFENLNINMNNNQFNGGNNMINSLITNQIPNFERNINENNSINSINNLIAMQTPNIMNNNANMIMNTNNMNNNINLNAFNNINNIGIMNHYNNFNNFNNINVINNMNNINSINNLNININDNYNYRIFHRNNLYNHNNINIKNVNNMYDDKTSGKFTCKYEILIENDPEFQIARKLIGSKGYNMKQIINECKIEGETESVKLRLRGKGSGYKEGPQNKESDEPLHLCVSSKTKEQMIKACFLVNQLLDKINEEYKIFCKKNGIKPKIDKIARKLENQNTNFKFNN